MASTPRVVAFICVLICSASLGMAARIPVDSNPDLQSRRSAAISNAAPLQLKNLDKDYWLEMYKGGQSYGSIHYTITREMLNHQPVYKFLWTLSERYVYSGTETVYRLTETEYIDSTFSPIQGVTKTVERSTPGSTHEAIYRVDYRRQSIYINVTFDGQVFKHAIPISSGAGLSAYYAYLLGARKLAVGQEFKGHIVDTTGYTPTLGLLSWDCRCVGTSTARLNGKSYDCFRIVENIGNEKAGKYEAISYVLADCTTIKRKYPGSNRAQIVAPDIQILQSSLHGSPNTTDTYMAIDTNRQLDNTKGIAHLQARLTDVPDDSFAKSDCRQTATFNKEKNTAEFSVSRKSFDSSKSLRLPINAGNYAEWLSPSAGIQSDDKDIQALSRQIIGNETDAYKAVCKLREWVYTNIKWQTGSDIPITATDVLKAGAGDCRHHAVMCAALARAAGIPTRLVQGIYSPGGLFFYAHAWVECYVGEWAPFEPGWAGAYPDATYIKLQDGDISVLEPMNSLSRSSLEILRCDYEAPRP